MDRKNIKVLYVDDERHNLYAFRAAFRFDFEIFLAESAEEGREILEKYRIPIIIADQRMPKETGIEFFESIKEKHPLSMRILLTGYTDIQAVISAVNIGNIFRYLQKPWKEEEIRTAIQNAFDLYDSRFQLVQKNIELEKAYNELDKFVYSASHDMRSPLMSILGIVRLAKMESSHEQSMPYFDMIEESVTRLDDFIKNIINYYKNNRISLEVNDINLQEVIENAIDSHKHQFLEYKIHFHTEVNQPFPVKSDLLKLQIILSNLINNAIKYQDLDKPEQRLTVKAFSEQNKFFISVEDNGIGIQKGDLDNIFKMFYRATNKNHGSGIGLYIAKEAVTHLNGEISVDSVLGEKTIFSLSLPNLT